MIQPLPQHLIPADHDSPVVPHAVYRRSVNTSTIKFAEKKGHHRERLREHHSNSTKQHYCGRRKKFQPHPPEEPVFFLDEYPDANGSSIQTRKRRSIAGNVHRSQYVETLVVVDKHMIKKHGSDKITAYVLTIFNMVAKLFRDSSLGHTINMMLVSLMLLEDDQPGLTISHHADRSLNSFCQWQSTLTTPNGTHHDHSILLTGNDICSWKNEPCDTLGFAPIGGMCSKYRSCTINEDTGLGLAFTVAHESGHSFGMVHDGDGNACRKSGGDIMSPTLSGHSGRFTWSACSRKSLDDFLRTDRAACTWDEPIGIAEYQFPPSLPGELYSADQQCQWQFGPKARLCSFNLGKSLCQSMWCHRGERRCETKFLPAADGTPCGATMWCIQGKCLDRGQLGPTMVHGNWSEYGEFDVCSRTCGGGVQYKERRCDNPHPQNGGKYCEGPSRIYRMCNIQECPDESVDFRAQQCSSYNSRPFRGFYYDWKPYLHVNKNEACKLYCIADGFDFYFALSGSVVDGTKCDADSNNVCVNGRCEKVGCDHILGSEAQPDACGVCHGDNSTCDFVRGVYAEQHERNDYYEVVRIPRGARQISVAELSSSDSYLALRNSKYMYYLTGGWTVDWPGNFKFGGTLFEYRRPYKKPEYLEAKGPTTEELIVEILLQGKNPGVEYEYTVLGSHASSAPPVHTYTWNQTYTGCSATCAGGVKTEVLSCHRNYQDEVDESFCDGTNRPEQQVVVCNKDPCPPRWTVSAWKPCNRQCGSGRQKRKVVCIKELAGGRNKTVKSSYCSSPRPQKWQACNTQDCPPKWVPGRWSECSRTCGDGFQTRMVSCVSLTGNGEYHRQASDRCRGTVKPHTRQPCNLMECPLKVQWFISAWSECSRTCGPGKRQRIMKCSHLDDQGQYRELPAVRCQHLSQPVLALSKPCNSQPCMIEVRGRWQPGEWSQCSATCDGGTKGRQVQCVSTNSVNSSPNTRLICDNSIKPEVNRNCNTDACPSQSAYPYAACRDEYNWCYLVPQHNVCSHRFYGVKCCHSCTYRG
ncbi:A disintegrin and metalloproteinase with thrombospondin motifs 18 [Strongylocentrotus purpuratus]|uniref:A disintegrin and metalloproteinase with thrombospondin motifs 18 n=1 Tax=Strongylocentrotus purpuratus TaxID=7668 RepID=A0A7M7HKY5_STRPU|nr:A disintegrin and metalloproteinase with thrombospondin motifs 18 [Strongylocentrotus purpuratus]